MPQGWPKAGVHCPVIAYALLACLAGWAAPLGPTAQAQSGAPRSVRVTDDPEDKSGSQAVVTWQPPAAGKAPPGTELVGYQILAGEAGRKLEPATVVGPGETTATLKDLSPRKEYMAQVVALYAPPEAEWYAPGTEPPEEAEHPVAAKAIPGPKAGPVRPVGSWYDRDKTNVLVGLIVYAIIVVCCFFYAQRGDMYVRPIAGLEAVEDAVGRATEMGKPMLFVAGLSSIGEISTIAAMLILGHLARRTAAYETPILVPAYDPLVMAAKREIVREAYIEAGRPQNFRPDNIFFVTDSQFGYVAAVDGIMLRERPAANFFMGSFAAESLILAETGNLTGAIQIAGTDSDTQIPFFITACDYTLIGEELYAASAYLSRHPTLLAQLKGQDIGKAIMTVLLVIGALLATMGAFGLKSVADFFVGLFAS